MVNRPIGLTLPLGNFVSRAVENFVGNYEKETGVRLESEPWYHDEPVWVVRQTIRDRESIVVRRVQVAVFDTPRGRVLRAIPDAYRVTPSKRKTVQPEDRVKNREKHVTALDPLLNNLRNAPDKVFDEVITILHAAWDDALNLEV